jgi:hypothetical protein
MDSNLKRGKSSCWTIEPVEEEEEGGGEGEGTVTCLTHSERYEDCTLKIFK